MALTSYAYDLDDPDHALLSEEILASGITNVATEFLEMEDDGTPSPGLNLTVTFASALSVPDKAILDAVIAAHPNSSPDPDPAEIGEGVDAVDVGGVPGLPVMDGSNLTSVVKPSGASLDNAVARYDGVTGELIQGSGIIVSDNDEVRHAGTVEQARGADLTAAATLALGADGNFFVVNGATTIAGLSPKPAGTVVTLHFAQALTVSHNLTSLKLQGNVDFDASATDHLSLISVDGVNWHEHGRVKAAPPPLLFEVYEAGGGQTIGAGPALVQLDSTRVAFDGLLLTGNRILVGGAGAGRYKVDARLSGVSTNRDRWEIFLAKNDTEIPGTRSALYGRNETTGSSANTFCEVTLAASDTLSLWAVRMACHRTLTVLANTAAIILDRKD